MARSPYEEIPTNDEISNPINDIADKAVEAVETDEVSPTIEVEEKTETLADKPATEEYSFEDELEEAVDEEPVEVKPITTVVTETKEEVKEEDEDLFGPIDEKDEEDVKENQLESEYDIQPRDIDVPEGYAEEIDSKYIPRFREMKVVNDDNMEAVIYALRGTQQSVNAALERLPSDLFDKEPTKMRQWWERVATARATTTQQNDQYIDVVTRKGAKWRNMLNHGTEEQPKWKGPICERGLGKNGADNVNAAFNLLSGMLRLGRPTHTPLYHTGIWVKLRTPTAASFITLDEINSGDKIEYGIRTRGEIFSNDGAVIRKNVANFVIDHIESTNAPSDDPEYLKEIIKVEDLNELMRALMQARYPDGYPLIQVCTVNPAECTESVEGLVDLRTLSWVDTNALTARQYQIISNPRKRITEEQLQEYQDEFKNGGKGRIFLSNEEVVDDNIINGAIVNIEMPTLAREEDYAVAWIQGIEAGLESIFKEKHDPEARRRRLNQIIGLNYFKTYGQYVSSVEIIEGGVKVKEFNANEHPDEIDQFFELVSGDVRYTERFINELKRYMAENIVSVVGILNYECPRCGKKHDTRPGRHHIVLPIDMLTTFFTLVRSSVRASLVRTGM